MEFDQIVADEICERLAQGQSLRKITGSDRDDFIPSMSTVLRWLGDDANEGFRRQYAHARELQAETLVDEIIEIADSPNVTTNPETGEPELRDVQRDRLRVDTRKWAASKLAPRKYGEKVELEHTGKVEHEHTADEAFATFLSHVGLAAARPAGGAGDDGVVESKGST